MTPISLVLLPGMDGTGLLFEPLIGELPRAINPVIISYPLNQPLTYRELLPIILEALPKHDPFILVGESFSGPLALMAAAQGLSNLKAVILCASFIQNPIPWLPKWAGVLARGGLFRLSRRFIMAKALIAGYATPRLMGLLDKVHSSVSPAVMALRAREILAVDVTAELKRCPVPVFYLGGANDRVVSRGNLKMIKRIRPSVQARLIPGPHLILQTKPQESSEAICAFIRELNPP